MTRREPRPQPRKNRKMATNVTRKLNGKEELELRPCISGLPLPFPLVEDVVSADADAEVAAKLDEEWDAMTVI